MRRLARMQWCRHGLVLPWACVVTHCVWNVTRSARNLQTINLSLLTAMVSFLSQFFSAVNRFYLTVVKYLKRYDDGAKLQQITEVKYLFGLSSMWTVEGDFFCQSFWNCTNMDYYRGQQCDRVSRGSHHVLSATILPQYIYARSASILNASRLWYQQHAAFHT